MNKWGQNFAGVVSSCKCDTLSFFFWQIPDIPFNSGIQLSDHPKKLTVIQSTELSLLPIKSMMYINRKNFLRVELSVLAVLWFERKKITP